MINNIVYILTWDRAADYILRVYNIYKQTTKRCTYIGYEIELFLFTFWVLTSLHFIMSTTN